MGEQIVSVSLNYGGGIMKDFLLLNHKMPGTFWNNS